MPNQYDVNLLHADLVKAQRRSMEEGIPLNVAIADVVLDLAAWYEEQGARGRVVAEQLRVADPRTIKLNFPGVRE
jgi:hypothetical protein